MSSPAVADRKRARKGTVADRRAYTDEQRRVHAERDAERLRLARELGSRDVEIAPEQGYLVVPPGPFADLTGPAMSDANELIESIGHDALVARAEKGGFVARGFLPETAFELGSPYLRVALDEHVVAPVAAYLGVVPVLNELDVWYSAYHPSEPQSSQLWHLDHADTTQVKVWVHLADVDQSSGPLTVVDAATSDRLAEAAGYNFGDSYRLPDDRVDELLGADGVRPLSGPAGTVAFVDTSRCFHFGSRVSPDGAPRRMLMIQYLTPYSFRYEDHRREAPYRELAEGASAPLQRLVLGAA